MAWRGWDTQNVGWMEWRNNYRERWDTGNIWLHRWQFDMDRMGHKQCGMDGIKGRWFLTFLNHLLVHGRPLFESSSIFDLVPCLQSAGISSCLPLRCPSISFSVGLCSFSQKPLVSVISHLCGCVLASGSGQTTLVFCFRGKFQQVLRALPSWCLHFWCDPTWSSLLPISTSSYKGKMIWRGKWIGGINGKG